MNGVKRRYLLDTNTVVSLLRGHAELLNLVQEAEWLGVSIVTWLEFLAFPNLNQADAQLFNRFLGHVEVVNLTQDDHKLLGTTVQLRQAHSLKLPDAIIVATALTQSATLVTADQRLLSLAGNLARLEVRAFTP